MIARKDNTKTILIMTFSVLAAMVALLLLNLNQLFTTKNEKYLAYNDVRGMAIEHKNVLYTLNFEQQNSVIEYLNRSIPIGKAGLSSTKTPLDFTKIIVYRFNKPDLTIAPIEYENDSFVFSAPELNQKGYLKDVSYGHLKELLSTTYDP